MMRNGLLSLLACAGIACAADTLSTWPDYRTVTINTSSTGANIASGTITDTTGIPILVRLTAAADSDVMSMPNGNSIRFGLTNGTTVLPYQQVSWVQNSAASFWVWVPSVTANLAAGATFNMYWGKSGAPSASSGPAVFDTVTGFIAVWHMDDSASTNVLTDATGYGHTATSVGLVAPTDITFSAAPSGLGKHFTQGATCTTGNTTGCTTGTTYAVTPDSNSTKSLQSNALDTMINIHGPYTISVWACPSIGSAGGRASLFSKYDSTLTGKQYNLGYNNGSAHWQFTDDGAATGAGEFSQTGSTTGDIALNAWQYVAGSYSATPAAASGAVLTKIALDGTVDAVGAAAGGNYTGGTGQGTTGTAYIGANQFSTLRPRYFGGDMDELWVSNVVRTQAWLKLEAMTSKQGAIAVTLGATQIQASAPGAPTLVTGTSGNTSVALTWTAPASNGGAAIISYTATSNPSGLTCISNTGSPVTPGCTVSGLTNGTSYTFTVTATNSAATSAPSTASAAITPATVPGAPTLVTGTVGNGQVTVSWTAPSSNGGSAITTDTVTASPGGATCAATGSGTSCIVTGLTNGTPYTFTVKASNIAGTGAASSPSSSVTPVAPVGVPGAPTGLTDSAGNGLVKVSWTAPSSNGGSAITADTVRSNPSGGICATTGALTCIVTGLTNGTSYTFTVTASNIAGSGVASSPSSAVTPIGPPGAPTGLTDSAGNGQVTVSWTAPSSNGGSAITADTVTASPGTAKCAAAGTATSCVVTGLTNGTVYTFTVKATNAAGTSAASSPSASITPSTVPGAPTITSAVGASGQVTVTWTAPSNGGSAITGYTVTASDTSKHCTTTTALSCAVTGLTNTTSYTFTVVASNVVGKGAAATSAPVTNILGFTAKNGFGLQMMGSSMLLRMPAVSGDVQVSILDVWGRTVWSRTVSGSIGRIVWDGNSNHGSSAPVGMYVLRLSFAKGSG